MNIIKLKEVIDSKGMSINELADKSGVDKGTISKILNGKGGCTVETAQKLSETLKLTLKLKSIIFFDDEVADTQQSKSS